MATPTSAARPSPIPARNALLLLLVVGALLALSVLLSKVAAGIGAPMLTYLAVAMGGSGLILTAMNGGIPRPASGLAAFVTYSFVAGALMALGSALGYLTVHRVGAAFISLALAFPPMLTWLISLVLRMERFDALRVGGLLVGLAGGVLLRSVKASVPRPTSARSWSPVRCRRCWRRVTCTAPGAGRRALVLMNWPVRC